MKFQILLYQADVGYVSLQLHYMTQGMSYLLSIALGVMDAAKDTTTLRDLNMSPFLWGEGYCVVCSYLYNTKLVVYKQYPSKVN